MEKDLINNRVLLAFTEILKENSELTKTELAQSLGIKPAKFTEILKGRMNAGADIMALLSSVYGISANWLLTGEGEMYRNQNNETTQVVEAYNTKSPDDIRLLIEEYKKHIESLDKSISSLEAQLAAKDAMIKQLLDIISQKQ